MAEAMVVFDLDACCWYPEMYMLWGGGAPFKQNGTEPNNTLTDQRGETVRLLGDVAASWAECHRRMQAGQPLLVGIASRSDEPSWARECLRKFFVAPSVAMMDVVTEGRCEIVRAANALPQCMRRRKTHDLLCLTRRACLPSHRAVQGLQTGPFCCFASENQGALQSYVLL